MRTRREMHFPYPSSIGSDKGRLRTITVGQHLARAAGAVIVAILLMGTGVAHAGSPAAAAKAFIETLSKDEAREALAAFDSTDRKKIRFTPGRRGGLSLKAMDARSLAAATRFLEQTLSAEGVRMVELIRQREAILGEITGRPGYRDPKLYYLAIFGDPGKGHWAYRFEGHHLSINMTYRDDKLISGMPVMLASNPEKTDNPGAPPELLGPLVADARASVADAAARQRVVEALTAHIPGPLRAAYRAGLSGRQALAKRKKTWRGFDLYGGEANVEIETNQTNHIHITFRDGLWDFGGGN